MNEWMNEWMKIYNLFETFLPDMGITQVMWKTRGCLLKRSAKN